MTQDVFYPGECSICTFAFGWNVLKISMRSISFNVSFKICVFLLIFCFDDLSTGVNVALKSPTIIVFSSVQFSHSVVSDSL